MIGWLAGHQIQGVARGAKEDHEVETAINHAKIVGAHQMPLPRLSGACPRV